MTSPDHDDIVVAPASPAPLPGRNREVRPQGLMLCCQAMIAGIRRLTDVGSLAQCPTCHAVVRVDDAGAWSWQPVATAEALRQWSSYG